MEGENQMMYGNDATFKQTDREREGNRHEARACDLCTCTHTYKHMFTHVNETTGYVARV